MHGRPGITSDELQAANIHDPLARVRLLAAADKASSQEESKSTLSTALEKAREAGSSLPTPRIVLAADEENRRNSIRAEKEAQEAHLHDVVVRVMRVTGPAPETKRGLLAVGLDGIKSG